MIDLNCFDEKIKILRIIARLNVGGPARHVVWLMSGLNKEYFDQTLICGRVEENEDDMSWFAEKMGVTPLIIPAMGRSISVINDLRSCWQIYKIVKKERPDIIHTHTSKAGFVGRVAVLVLRLRDYILQWFGRFFFIKWGGDIKATKLVHTFHGHTFYNYFSPLKGFIFLSIERFLGRFTDKIIVISKQQFKEICFDFKVGKEDNFEVIPIGIDLVPFQDMLQFKRLLRKEYGIDYDKIVVGAMGRITDIKNYKMLVNVSSKLKAQNPNLKVHFFIFGGGSKDDIRVLKEYIKENNVEDIFHLTGNVEKPERALADVDIGALTSLNEGTPVSLLEAMAAGKPIISTAVGGVVDLLGSEADVKGEGNEYDLWDRRFRVLERGILVNSKDDDGFVDGLKFLIKNKRLMALMGDSGRRFVKNNYSKDRLIYDIERLYLNNV